MELYSFCIGFLLSFIALPLIVIIVVSIRRMILDGSRIEDLTKKYILITGCDTGFGYLAAKQLDVTGCCVIATCLTDEGKRKLQSLLSAKAHVLSLDVTSMESIQAAEKCIQQFLPTPDALWAIVNNAGILAHAGVFDFDTLENMKRVADVNVWGTVAVTKTFLPYLKKSKGRIVNIGSAASRISAAAMSSYSISKFAVAAFTDCIRLEMALWGISAHLLEPGGFQTDLVSKERVAGLATHFWNNTPADVRMEYNDNWYKEARDLQKLEVAQIQRLRFILGVTLKDHMRNADIHMQCCQQLQVHLMVTRSRLRWFGHVLSYGRYKSAKAYLMENTPYWMEMPSKSPLLELEKSIGRRSDIGILWYFVMKALLPETRL